MVLIVDSGKIILLPEILILPKNIAPGDRPNKEEVSCNDIWYHDLIFHSKQYNFYFRR